jgi:hypothetical protein
MIGDVIDQKKLLRKIVQAHRDDTGQFLTLDCEKSLTNSLMPCRMLSS